MDEDSITAALARIVDPGTGMDLVASGQVASIAASGGTVQVVLEIPAERAQEMMQVAKAAEAALAVLPGVEKAAVILTAQAGPGATAPSPPKGPPKGPPPDLRGAGRGGGSAGGQSTAPGGQQAPQGQKIPGVARILAVGSGKGGVGKSTVAANLAVALAREGRRTGLLDADVYGPSQPRMMGVSTRPTSPDGERIDPLHAHGVTMMSMGVLVPEDTATVWRGPMLMKALMQLLFSVNWGELDVLVVDLPPGTGDVQLTLAQRAEVTGAVIVSTPQDVALLDARKAIDMFRKTGVPLSGMIENMSTFACPRCGAETHLFGHGGAREEAGRIGAPFLGEIPLDLDTRLSGDAGTPVVAAHPDSAPARRFSEIARALVEAGAA